MKMDIVADSKNDEFWTPRYAVEPLLKYLKPSSTVWCPFDTEDSMFTITLRENGYKVLFSHLSMGIDFFNISDISCDYIISNPPYSRKGEIIQRLFEIGKPFAMLVGVVGLFESQKRFNMFRENNFEIMYFNKRVSFLDKPLGQPVISPPFSSVYICKNILPNRIVFETIHK
jgi:hypothetical protein